VSWTAISEVIKTTDQLITYKQWCHQFGCAVWRRGKPRSAIHFSCSRCSTSLAGDDQARSLAVSFSVAVSTHFADITWSRDVI